MVGTTVSFKLIRSARFFVGLAESALAPGILFYLSMWYPRRYLALRVGLYTSAVVISGEVDHCFLVPEADFCIWKARSGDCWRKCSICFYPRYCCMISRRYGIERMDGVAGRHGWQWIVSSRFLCILTLCMTNYIVVWLGRDRFVIILVNILILISFK